jgi:hypothetical protein
MVADVDFRLVLVFLRVAEPTVQTLVPKGDNIRVYLNSNCILRVIAGPSGRSPTAIMGSNPTGGMDICLLCDVR